MADSGISFKLLLDSSGFTEGVRKAKEEMKKFIDESGKKSFFEKLNTDVKRVTSTFADMGRQLGNKDVFGALSSASKLASMSIGELGGMALPLAGIAAAAVATGAAVNGMWNSMSRANEIKNIADSSLMTSKELLGLEMAFMKAGISIDEMPTIFGHFLESINQLGDPMSKVSLDFARIGLNADSFDGKTMAQSVEIFASALQNAKNKSDALAASQDAFSLRKGGRMLSVLTPENIEKSKTQVLGNADIYQRQAQQFLDFQNALRMLRPSLDSFFAGLNSSVIPVFNELVSRIERVDFSGLGSVLGMTLVPALTGLSNVLIMLDNTMKSLVNVKNSLSESFKIPDSIKEGIKNLSNKFSITSLIDPMLWKVITSPDLFPSKSEKFKNENLEPAQSSAGVASKVSNIWGSILGSQFSGIKKKAEIETGLNVENTAGVPKAKEITTSMPEEEGGPAIKIPRIPLPLMVPTVSSLTKIGGGGTEQSFGVDIQREQLSVLRDIARGIQSWGGQLSPSYRAATSSMYGQSALAY
jgi:hypothetical protein